MFLLTSSDICSYIKDLGEAVTEVAIYPAQLGEGGDEEAGVAEVIEDESILKEKRLDIAVDEVKKE